VAIFLLKTNETIFREGRFFLIVKYIPIHFIDEQKNNFTFFYITCWISFDWANRHFKDYCQPKQMD
jgi:hypothetical protein